MVKLGRNLDLSQGTYMYTFQNKYEISRSFFETPKNVVKSLVSQIKMFVCQKIKSGQAKPNDIKPCRPKTEVAPHDFAKIAHHYERSLAHTSTTPNMIKRRYEVCEKWPTKAQVLEGSRKVYPNKECAIEITFQDYVIRRPMFGWSQKNRFDLRKGRHWHLYMVLWSKTKWWQKSSRKD